MTTAQKLQIKYNTAKVLNIKLAAEIGEGNGAVGLTATFFMNASRDLAKIQRQVRNAVNNGEITVAEYQAIMA